MSSSCSSSQQQQQQERIHFSRQVIVVPTLSLNDYTDEEMEACWYTDNERQQIKRCANETLSWMNNNSTTTRESSSSPSSSSFPVDLSCTRGLEHHTRQGVKSRYYNRRNAYDAVLDEQDRQYDDNDFDEDIIASVYAKVTASSRLQAYLVALEDQKESQHDDNMSYYDGNSSARVSRTLKRVQSDSSFCGGIPSMRGGKSSALPQLLLSPMYHNRRRHVPRNSLTRLSTATRHLRI